MKIEPEPTIAGLRASRDKLAKLLEKEKQRAASLRHMPGRYAAFACYAYYPSGGMSDCVGTFETEAEAWRFLRENYASRENHEVHDLLMSIRKAWRAKV